MNKEKQKNIHQIATTTASVALGFIILVTILLCINYYCLKSASPLQNDNMQKLIELSQKDPSNLNLKENIRNLDLLTRRAYFNSITFANTGIILLLAGITTLLASILTINKTTQKLPNPLTLPTRSDASQQAHLSQYFLTIILTIITITTIAIHHLSKKYLITNYYTTQKKQITTTKKITPKNNLNKLKKNWVNFRGMDNNAIAYTTNLPQNWNINTGKNILWQATIKLPGFNSPIIWEDKLFVSGADAKNEVVYCYDANTGKLLWQTKLQNIPNAPETPPTVSQNTGFAAATMTTDGKNVFAIFATGNIACLSLTGKQIWATNIAIPENDYGYASSLIIHNNKLFVQFDQSEEAILFAIDTKTGNTIWEKERDVEVSWASPILARTNNQTQLILYSKPKLIAYNPDTGKKIWEKQCMSEDASAEIAVSPAYANGIVYVTNQYTKTVAIDIQKQKIIWENNNEDIELPDVSSPLATQKHLFLATSAGVVYCLDNKTGKLIWEHEFETGFYASPILADNNIYLLDMNAQMHIIKAAPPFKQIATIKMKGQAVCTPAITNQKIYLRIKNKLIAIGKK